MNLYTISFQCMFDPYHLVQEQGLIHEMYGTYLNFNLV